MNRLARRRSPRLVDRLRAWDSTVPTPPYTVIFWPGTRPQDGSGARTGTVYTRAHLLEGLTPVVFVKDVGAVALSHVDPHSARSMTVQEQSR